MKPIDNGPLRDWLPLADAIGLPVFFGLLAVGLALWVLQNRGARIGERRIQPSEPTRDVMLGLLMALSGPVFVVYGAAHYIVQAGTGSFQVASDFRNSQAWVDALYVFMAIAAPLSFGFGLALSADALLRRRRLQHPRPAPTSATPAEDQPKRQHRKHHKHYEAD
jgi:hypothetical protein